MPRADPPNLSLISRTVHAGRGRPGPKPKQARRSLADWLKVRRGEPEGWVFPSRMIEGAHRKTGNLRACQLLLGHTKLESTVRYLGVELDDALALSEALEI